MSVLRRILRAARGVVQSLRALPAALRAADEKTFYPEKQRKSRVKRVLDNIWWTLKYHEVNRFYTQYGLDLEDSNAGAFLDCLGFMNSRNRFNHVKQLDSQIILLRDKFLFFKYMQAMHLPVPEVFAVMKDGVLYDTELCPMDPERLKEEKDYFVKDIAGECASFVKHIHDYAQFSEIRGQMDKGSYIFQRRIFQCEEMNRLNPHAINTLRIVTFYNDGDPSVFASILRVGTALSGNVDNTAAGGIAAGVEADGHLKPYGFFKPAYGTRTEVHPDTGIILREFEVPMYQQALETACRAHRSFYGVRSIGWDVALTTEGPVFIEGNDNWEISSIQALYGGVRERWNQVTGR